MKYPRFYNYLTILFFTHQALSDNYELQLTNPMMVTSLRTFEQVSDDLYVFKGRNGSVIVNAEKGFGIMAVVMEMNLQDVQQPPRCLDYIKMSQVSGGHEESKEICGHLESHASPELVKRPSFVDKTGLMELNYMLYDKSRLSPLDTKITNFNITFTPFTECPEEAFPFGNKILRPCSVLDTFSCISSDLFCDGIINCGFPHELGLDELNCPDTNEDAMESSEEDYLVLEDDMLLTNESLSPSSNDPLDNSTLQERIRVLLVRSCRRANLGVLATLTVFVLLYTVAKLSGSGSSGRRSLITYGGDCEINSSSDVKSSGDGVFLITDSEYDEDKDPVPSYQECLFNYPSSGPVYSQLSYECEQPPSYEEVRVHHWATKPRLL